MKKERVEKKYLRGAYEFNFLVKLRVSKRSGGVCEMCKTNKAQQYHHVISIDTAIKSNMPPSQIATDSNCQHLCKSCHDGIHNN